MIPKFNKVHNKFKLNSSSYRHLELKDVAYNFLKEGLSFEKLIGKFLLNWLDDKDYIVVTTSGSTGNPKQVKLQKQAMVNSAIATGDFFKLKPTDKALHCLPANYIAGKMMLVRAIILGLEIDLIEPTLNPIINTKKYYNFCAMIPLQLQKSLKNVSNIKTIIVGGATVSSELKQNIQDIKPQVYETYGMTETITHIAVKQLNNFTNVTSKMVTERSRSEEPHFKTLPNISILQDKRGCLVIEAPNISEERIVTNDIVKLHSKTEFTWLGRYDNVINSGGKKVFPEQIEAKLKGEIKYRCFITSVKDMSLGNQIILILEAESNNLKPEVFKKLSKHEIPKKVYAINKFIETSNGKIQRKKTLALIKL